MVSIVTLLNRVDTSTPDVGVRNVHSSHDVGEIHGDPGSLDGAGVTQDGTSSRSIRFARNEFAIVGLLSIFPDGV